MPDGYDVIGDIHGYAEELKSLLKKLGYEERGGAFRHSARAAVFITSHALITVLRERAASYFAIGGMAKAHSNRRILWAFAVAPLNNLSADGFFKIGSSEILA